MKRFQPLLFQLYYLVKYTQVFQGSITIYDYCMKRELATGHWRVGYQMLLEMKVYKMSAQNMKAIIVGLGVVFIALKGLSPEKSYNLKRTLIKVYKSFCSCNLDSQKDFEYIMAWGHKIIGVTENKYF